MDILARWTVIEQRYPALADLLFEQPDLIECFVKGSDQVDILPEEFVVFSKSDTIAEIITDKSVLVVTSDIIQVMTKSMKG